MHEWALAEAVITAASQIAEKEGLKEITELKITIGELQQVEVDILRFALSELKAGKSKKARITIKAAKAKLQCKACGHRWVFSKEKMDRNVAEAIHFVPEVAHTFIRCARCGSPDFEILEGRGVWLETVKGVK